MFSIFLSLPAFSQDLEQARLMEMVRSGKRAELQQLIREGKLKNSNVEMHGAWKNLIHIAAESGQTEILADLIRLETKGANLYEFGINHGDAYQISALQYAAMNGNEATVIYFIQYMRGIAELEAKQMGRKEIDRERVGALLSSNFATKKTGTPLELAKQHGHHGIVQLLEAAGAK